MGLWIILGYFYVYRTATFLMRLGFLTWWWVGPKQQVDNRLRSRNRVDKVDEPKRKGKLKK